MKGIAGSLIAIVLFALLGVAALVASRFERNMAEAQQRLATLDYGTANTRLADAERYAAYATWVPSVGDRVTHELRARQAALRYWERHYDEVLPRGEDPVGAVDAQNVDLQLVVANAAFRAGQAQAKDRETTIKALDEAVGSYLSVLKNEEWNRDAAYNYEYLIRLRDEYAKSRRTPPPPSEDKDTANGMSGAPEATSDTRKFEIYVPLENTERTKAAEAGKATPNKRKG